MGVLWDSVMNDLLMAMVDAIMKFLLALFGLGGA